MHANQTPAETTSTSPSDHTPVLTRTVSSEEEGPSEEPSPESTADDDTEEAGYGYGV